MAYLKLFALLNQSGERIIIDGPCLSACTLLLTEIPHGRVCVTSRAILGFHAAELMDGHGRKYPAPMQPIWSRERIRRPCAVGSSGTGGLHPNSYS